MTPDPRSDPRANVFLTATLYADGIYPVRIRNLSIHGVLIEGASLPCEGVAVRLRRGSLGLSGEIAWQRGKHCGVHFETPISVDEWVKGAGSAAQQGIDAAIAEIRNGGMDPRPLGAISSQAPRQLLEDAASDLSRICERISALPDMSIVLAEEIVRIDSTIHVIRTAARLVR